jgi:DNA repair exonuclease SbcCD ATPase subunit
MIIFEKIRWRNFLSTGNHFTEIALDTNSTTLIVGNNGAGKSTVLDALTFSLFGKPFRRINKPQLANSVNERDCLVEVEFSISNVEWKVRRGIKPNIFEIYRNGSLLDQNSASLDQQRWFEQTVLKMNYKSFTQIVILGSGNFTPFMQLSAANRREVIEDLLDIKIFSSMNSLVKDKIREKREDVKVLEIKKDSLTDRVNMQRDFIDEVEKRGNANINAHKEKIANLSMEIGICTDENETTAKRIEDLTEELEDVKGSKDKLKKLGSLKGKISQKVVTVAEEHKFFNENTVCPTCKQDIEESFRLNRIEDTQNKAKELQTGFLELERAIKDEEERECKFINVSTEVTKLTHGISQNNIQISGLQRQVRDLESEIQRITDQLANRNTEHEKLENYESSLSDIYDTLSSRKQEINNHEFVFNLLKDSGVKSKIIKKYLPLINQQVNRYLQMMDFYINFTLDDEFNETVQSPIHEDFSYASFSEGEKMRIDLALLFTWREVAKFKNSVNTNLLIMDEVFDSSLDGFGTEEFLRIIRFVVKDANIFVISHKSGLEEKFNKLIRFEKVKGFSVMVA